MANQWFKFFGGEYLSDPKMLALSSSERSCWITLLCYTSVINDTENDNEYVKHVTEERLMLQAGIDIGSDEWEKTKGVLSKFEELEMIHIDNEVITVLNWKKRQQSSLTPYERVKRHREKKRNDNANDNRRVDKSRVEENRNTNTAEETPASYDFQTYLAEMEKSKRRDVQVIAFYLKKKGLKFESLKEVQTAIRRHLRPAREVANFPDEKIVSAYKIADTEYKDKYTVETLLKILTR